MIIHSPQIKEISDTVIIEFRLSDTNLAPALWFNIPKAYRSFISDSLDAALVALLLPAMRRKENIILKGPVSEKLLYNCRLNVQAFYKLFLKNIDIVDIKAESIVNDKPGSNNVFTGFSGGVDSFTTLQDHFYDQQVMPGFKITHLLFNNVGSHSSNDSRLINEKYSRLKKLADSHDLPLINIDSNMHEFYAGFNFLQTHILRNSSVVLLLQKGIGRYLYSSDSHYYQISIKKFNSSMAHGDFLALPMLSTESTEILNTGSHYYRVDKIAKLTSETDTYQYLDVCIDEADANNCSACYKCLRTLLSLEVLGKLYLYENIFDLTVYQKNRFRFIYSLFRSNNVHDKEILKLAKKEGFVFPWTARLCSWFRVYGLLKFLRLSNYSFKNFEHLTKSLNPVYSNK